MYSIYLLETLINEVEQTPINYSISFGTSGFTLLGETSIPSWIGIDKQFTISNTINNNGIYTISDIYINPFGITGIGIDVIEVTNSTTSPENGTITPFSFQDTSTNYIELDTEEIDMKTIFSISDVTDISNKKDTITKTIVFKGSKKNNEAFGHLYNLNKSTDITIQNKILFNYASLRPVDCIVYEETLPLFRGSLIVLEIDVNEREEVEYQAVITGNLFDFRSTIQEKLLSDLDFTDLKHTYNMSEISASWYNTTGFVYPYADYGYFSKDNNANPNDLSKLNFYNLKPAIYLKEYLKKMFKQVKGFTYEIKGSNSFKEAFNKLIIPTTQETIVNTWKGNNVRSTALVSSSNTNKARVWDDSMTTNSLQFNFDTITHLDTSQKLIDFNSKQWWTDGTKPLLIFPKKINTDLECKVRIHNMTNPVGIQLHCFLQVCERDYIDITNQIYPGFDSPQSWNVITQTQFNLAVGETIVNRDFTLYVTNKTYDKHKQLMLRIFNAEINLAASAFQLDTASISLAPYDTSSTTLNIELGDEIIPTAPTGIKQTDFLKSIINLLNFYVYPSKNNPKHFIFEKYDDYYSLANIQYLKEALNWTNKIDYKGGFKIKTNVNIPKSYKFTYKADKDFYNDTYYKKYNQVYGTFSFADSLGNSDEKKIELIFSPSVTLQEPVTKTYYTPFFGIDGSNKKPITTNIRILYYNGLINTGIFKIQNDAWDSSNNTYTATDVHTGTLLPQATSYLFDSTNKPVSDLNFGEPYEYYFPAIDEFQKASTAYNNYIKKISELTNPETSIIECKAWLNEIDIANLDLKTPVFIDTNGLGHAYFKVLSIEYFNNKETSLVTLQKIVY